MDTQTTDQTYPDRLDQFEAEIERLVDAEIAAIRAVPLGTRRRRKTTGVSLNPADHVRPD